MRSFMVVQRKIGSSRGVFERPESLPQRATPFKP
jgi:hypothetical protein